MICVREKQCDMKRIIFVIVSFLMLIKTSSSENDINCVILKHCPMALKLVETKRNDPVAIKFLRFTHCGFKGKEPMVWCNMFDKCKTPDGKDGKCISVRDCNPFVMLIKQVDISKPTMGKYLNEFRCSTVYDPNIKVCCPPDEKIGEECGMQKSNNRIYGGVETEIDEFPWMALIRYQQAHGGFAYGCGGSIINSKYVLTAAHCLDPIILKSRGLRKIHRVILGEYDIKNKTDCIYQKYGKDCADPVQEYELESFKLHPGYMSGYAEHDIGIIKLPDKIIYTDFIKPICLPSATLTLTEKDIYMIAGWGKTAKDKISSVKRKAMIEIVDKNSCNQYTDTPLDESKICAGSGNGVDACFGDSGGPLMLGRNLQNHYINFVIGIVSHGFGRTCGERPGVYTYVPYYVDWIRSSLTF